MEAKERDLFQEERNDRLSAIKILNGRIGFHQKEIFSDLCKNSVVG